jgi:GAF domain-containing protein
MVVPLLYDDEIVGIITLSRKQVQPLADEQISLFDDFAAEATIALESWLRAKWQYWLQHLNRKCDRDPR